MVSQTSQLVARPANWLPIPQVGLAKKTTDWHVDVDDLFSKGEVAKFYPRQGWGFIKDRQGKEIYFSIEELDLVGPKADKSYISVGAHVGYDVSWTSSGPHIRAIKIY